MKIFWRSFIGAVIIIFVAISLCYTLLPSIVSHSLSKRMEVSVSIGGISLGTSKIGINAIYIGNPPNSILPQALKVDKIQVDIPASHFFHKKIVIPYLGLNDIYLGLEFNSQSDRQGNWTYIMKNLSDSNSNSSDAKSDVEVMIKRVVLNNLTVAIVYKDQPKNIKTVQIPSLEFTDVSSKGGIPSAQITQLIMRHALQQVFSKENLQNMIKDVLSPNSGGGGFFKGLFSLQISLNNDEHETSTGDEI
ncbi:MAG: hypothetical protein P0S95_06480 [Rhabdochlamydiaceae bacterium]|nr:hypothetical protein [Candidatus Amphrikana amoebophyrae]